MNYKKRIPTLLLLIGILLTATGCNDIAINSGGIDSQSSENSSVTDNTGFDTATPEKGTGFREYFYFYPKNFANEASLVLDEYGNVVPKDKQFTVLYDILTGEPQCQKLDTVEDTGKVNEYGGAIVKRSTTLFDKDGKQITDSINIDHYPAFGDFVILSKNSWIEDVEKNDAPKGLWNFKTGKLILEGVGRLDIFDAEKKLLVASRASSETSAGEIMGIIDETGRLISTPKTDVKYWLNGVFNGMMLTSIILENQDEKQYVPDSAVVFSKDFETIFEADSIWFNYGSLYGDYINYKKGETGYIADYDFKTCFEYSNDDNINYFDGECVINYSRNISTGEFMITFSDINANVFASELITIDPIVEDRDKKIPAELFAAVDEKGIYIYNRKGEIVASKLQEGIMMCTYIGNGFITYELSNGKSGLLDMELKTLIEPDKYRHISRGYSWENGMNKPSKNLLYCTYELNSNKSITRVDLLDGSLKPIMENISNHFGSTDDLIAIKKGFSMGLIDYDGNWVHKHSIFNEFEMEDSDEWGIY